MRGCTLAMVAKRNDEICASTCTILRHSGPWNAVDPSALSFSSHQPPRSSFNLRRFSPPIGAIHSHHLCIDTAAPTNARRRIMIKKADPTLTTSSSVLPVVIVKVSPCSVFVFNLFSAMHASASITNPLPFYVMQLITGSF